MQNYSLRKKILIALAGLVATFIVLYFFVLNTYISIELSSSSPNDDTSVGYVNSDGVVKQGASLFGIHMVPRSSGSIIVQGSDRETRVALGTTPIIGFKTITVDLAVQKTLSKVGKDGQSCNGMTSLRVIFNYSCTEGSNDVFTFANKKIGQFENPVLPTTLNPDRDATEPYGDGVLSLMSLNDRAVLEYTNIQTSDIKQRQLPYDDVDSVKLFTHSSTDSIVIVNNSAHELLFYSSLDAEPTKYSVSDFILYGTCGVAESRFTCATTEPAKSDDKDSHGAENEETADHSRIVSFDTATKKQDSIKINGTIEKICLTDDGTYYRGTDDVLRFIRRSESSSSAIHSSIVSMHCTNDTVVYNDSSSLYRLASGTSQLLLRQDRLVLSKTYANSKSTLINTFVRSDESATLHTFDVTDEPLKTDRVETILPYEIPGDLPIFEMDYDDDTIYIKPFTSISTNKSLGTTTVDQEALNTTKQIIEDKLRKDGILDRFKLTYY